MSDSNARPEHEGEHRKIRHAPEMIDDDTMRLYGVGPSCPGCGGPTHCVTDDEDAERPWYCKYCNVRLDDSGDYGSQAIWPSGSEPVRCDGGRPRHGDGRGSGEIEQ